MTTTDPRRSADKAMARADRICLVEADRPTWIGDRLRACHVRIDRAYGLDLNAAWPRLWLIVPDTVRTELGAARDAFSSAARLTAWAILYLILGIWWWPAIPIALITGTTAIIKAHLATDNLADLIESTVDLHRPGPRRPARREPDRPADPRHRQAAHHADAQEPVGPRLAPGCRRSRDSRR